AVVAPASFAAGFACLDDEPQMKTTPSLNPPERRARRAMIAHRLMAKAADAAAVLDWETLDRAPGWLGLPEGALALCARRIGAVLCAPALRLWIDGPRIAAARAA